MQYISKVLLNFFWVIAFSNNNDFAGVQKREVYLVPYLFFSITRNFAFQLNFEVCKK